jgi:hypothetical protein
MTSLDRFPIIIKKFEELKKRWYDDKCDDSKLTDEQRIIKRLANDKLNEVDIKQINLLNHLLTSINENLVLFEFYKDKLNELLNVDLFRI